MRAKVKKLLIIGASGHGKVVADIAMKMNRWQHIAFLDDDETIKSSMGLEVIGKTDDGFQYIPNYDIFTAIGNNNNTRETIHNRLKVAGASIPILIHPQATISKEVEIGTGTVIMAGVVINCCTTIGEGCIINTAATIDHDNTIENFVHISPGVHTGGTVRIGQGTWLGIGSIVVNNLNITNNCIIGAGAVVINDITEPGTYIGIPAQKT
jgi:sugar O-acyltransferase (sialic acid O-acetyltransferase NeuD family)